MGVLCRPVLFEMRSDAETRKLQLHAVLFTLTCTYGAQRPEPNTGSDFTIYVATLGIHYLSVDMMANCDTEGCNFHK